MLLKSIVLLGCQENSLTVKGTSELLGGQVSLAEDIMIIEELDETNTILFDNLFNLLH